MSLLIVETLQVLGASNNVRKCEMIVAYSRKAPLHFEDTLQLVQKPFINLCHLPYLVDAVSPLERRGYCKDPPVSRIEQLFIDILNEIIL